MEIEVISPRSGMSYFFTKAEELQLMQIQGFIRNAWSNLYRGHFSESLIREKLYPKIALDNLHMWVRADEIDLCVLTHAQANTIDGVVCLVPSEIEGARKIQYFYLAEHIQGEGVGSRIMEIVVEVLCFQNSITLEVFSENHKAFCFYQKHLFRDLYLREIEAEGKRLTWKGMIRQS
ncbi:MAG: GNAT family N-acetyltransferase [bacterium]|nr:GNAT family N-acetyltransferase [bacterium]